MVPTHNLPLCNKYFVRLLAAASKNDRFELKSELALVESVFEFDVLIFSTIHLQFAVSNVFYVQYWILVIVISYIALL